jgi:hypothetical protein
MAQSNGKSLFNAKNYSIFIYSINKFNSIPELSSEKLIKQLSISERSRDLFDKNLIIISTQQILICHKL